LTDAVDLFFVLSGFLIGGFCGCSGILELFPCLLHRRFFPLFPIYAVLLLKPKFIRQVVASCSAVLLVYFENRRMKRAIHELSIARKAGEDRHLPLKEARKTR